ncbi:Fc receptor-like protein 5 [Notolabrus celidotus]|uniref:Fc receptor-like protein 5 n=1 Tax=Notolabrus celidotus TaxID=1203425 RepID=UPI00148F937C|nr:Fc receptor-like protein 5 [Notolabrus celidotus]
MEVSGLCIRLLIHMFILMFAHAHKVVVSDSVFLHPEPNRLQFFEYKPVTFHCEGFYGSTGLNVVHQTKGKLPSCSTKTTMSSTVSSCTLRNVYLEDSGEYWCESGGGKRSNSINITVTAGSVVLESPVLPVTEGEAVTLRCRNKTTSSNRSAEFYKDGVFIRSSSTGQMVFQRVSKCDKGFYKCRISGGEESAESWLAVKGLGVVSAELHSPLNFWFMVFRNVLPVVMMSLLLLMLGFLHCGKRRDIQHHRTST